MGMRGLVLGTAIMLAGALDAGAQDDAPGVVVNPDAIAELVFGVYCAEAPVRTEDAPDTVAGVVNIVPGLPEIRFAQTVVPAAIDIGFGVLVRGQPAVPLAPVTVMISHPPFPGSGVTVQSWETSIDADGLGLIGFSFDTANELVPGRWHIAAKRGEVVLFDVAFEVVPPAAAASVIAACMGGVTS